MFQTSILFETNKFHQISSRVAPLQRRAQGNFSRCSLLNPALMVTLY